MTTSRSAFVRSAAAFAVAAPLVRPPAARAADSLTIVLVHGELVGPRMWDRVTPLLAAHGGAATVAVTLGMRSLRQDVADVRRVVAGIAGTVVLAGHSYGGAVISGTAGLDNVRALAFVAGIALDEGETIGQLLQSFPHPASATDLVPVQGGLALRRDKFVEDYAGDLDAGTAGALRDAQASFAETVLGEPGAAPAWKAVPSWYAASTRDGIIAPALQAHCATRMKATVTNLDASHAAPLSRPADVASVILAAAGSVRPR